MPEPFFLTLLKALLYAASALIFLNDLSLPAGQVGGVLGAVAGVFLARSLPLLKIRRGVLLGILAAGLALSTQVEKGWLDSGFIASVLGPRLSLQGAEGIGLALLFFFMVLFFRTLTLQFPSWAILEVVVVTGAVIRLFAGHRGFNLTEPRFLSDWVWSHGVDPIALLMKIGAAAFCLTTLLLLEKQQPAKAAFSMITLVILSLLVLEGVHKISFHPPDPREKIAQGSLTTLGSHAPPGGNAGSEDSHTIPRSPSGGGDEENSQDELSKTGQEKSQGKNPPQKKRQGAGKTPQDMDQGDQSFPQPPQPVAIVLFHDDYNSVEGTYYFRQTAFSQFNGKRLVRATREGADLDLLDSPSSKQASPSPFSSSLFTQISTTVAVIADQKQYFGLVHPSSYQGIDNPNPTYFREAYQILSRAPHYSYKDLLGYPAGDAAWSDQLRRHYLEYPSDPRYPQLAQQLVKKLFSKYRNSPLAQALAIRRWLEKNTIYTLAPQIGQEKDPTASFLFGNRKGHCVHLAHSMAYLLRSLGTPARVSAGYMAPEARRQLGSSLLLQDRDAHAWAELYLKDVGWVAIDPSPERSEDEPPPEVGPELQKLMGELARRNPPQESEQKPLFPWKRQILWGLFSLVLGVIGGGYLVKLWRRYLPRFATGKHQHRWIYRSLLDRLAQAGYRRRFGRTREDFSALLASEFPELALLTSAHLRAALSQTNPLSREEWRGLEKQISKQISRGLSWKRKFWAWINPFSWWGVR